MNSPKRRLEAVEQVPLRVKPKPIKTKTSRASGGAFALVAVRSH
jgi:hypothetical protein